MPFEPGHKKYGGIQKGQKHPRTLVKDKVDAYLGKDLITAYLETLDEHTSPRELREAYAVLLPYYAPKLAVAEIDLSADVVVEESEKIQALAMKLAGLNHLDALLIKEES